MKTFLNFSKRWIAPIISIVGFEWLCIELTENTIGKDNFKYTSLPLFSKIYILSSVGIIIYLLWIVIILHYDYIQIKNQRIKLYDKIKNNDVTDSFSRILMNAYTERRWSEVIKIGHTLSEPLWYTGKFLMRLDIGELVESAAAFEKKHDIQAETLIDDLGWTNFRLKNEKEANKNILLGLKIAEKSNNFYLIAKANRHFADISLANKKFDECLRFLLLAYSFLRRIENALKKIEMRGNLQYTVSKYYLFARKDYYKALKAANQSLFLYQSIDDMDRAVKLFNLRGKIFLSLEQEENAITSFQEGLTLATHISNIVNIVNNSASLAERNLNNHRYDFAKQMIGIANQNSKAMDDPILIETLNNLSILIDSKVNQKK